MNKLLLIASLLFSSGLCAQNIIRGLVIDSKSDEALPGVNISEKGSLKIISTDAGGFFSIPVSSSSPDLIFSFSGMVTKEIILPDTSFVNIRLEKDQLRLNEVAVTAINIPKNKRKLTTAVHEISAAEINLSGEGNVTEAIAGKAAGVE